MSDRGRWHPPESSLRLRLWMRKRRDRDWLSSPSQLKHRKSLTIPPLASIPHRLSRLTDSLRSERWLDDEASSATALRSPTSPRSTKAGLERILAVGRMEGRKLQELEREEDRWYRTSLHYGTATERQDETTQASTGLFEEADEGRTSESSWTALLYFVQEVLHSLPPRTLARPSIVVTGLLDTQPPPLRSSLLPTVRDGEFKSLLDQLGSDQRVLFPADEQNRRPLEECVGLSERRVRVPLVEDERREKVVRDPL